MLIPAARFLRRSGCRVTLIILLLLTVILVIWSAEVVNVVTYGTRPLWDDPGEKWTVFPSYGLQDPKEICELHGWKVQDPPKKMVDAIIFSVELDLLELRLRELYPVVDEFVILETNTTFTGKPKPLVFQEHQERFAFAKDKIKYKAIPGRTLKPGESPFVVENAMRINMTMFLVDLGLQVGDNVIMADVDEIPSRESISLLRSCEFQPDIIHLRMKNFIYSFDFMTDMDHWRAKVVRVPEAFYDWFYGDASSPNKKAPFYYGHQRASNHILSDAGWHCSFCFPKLKDFVFKMTAYSHADRVTNKKLLDRNRIQRIICEGKDIFGMLPEAYTFRDLIWKWGPARKMDSVTDVPKYLLEMLAHKERKFHYLLPGGCVRDG
ncbi:hypothetical protein HDU97_008920 [Phlyctochytrium planicorne]|nr:hypothetical protein HDU97_008920 [Phlyctochytrium planicorne]